MKRVTFYENLASYFLTIFVLLYFIFGMVTMAMTDLNVIPKLSGVLQRFNPSTFFANLLLFGFFWIILRAVSEFVNIAEGVKKI